MNTKDSNLSFNGEAEREKQMGWDSLQLRAKSPPSLDGALDSCLCQAVGR